MLGVPTEQRETQDAVYGIIFLGESAIGPSQQDDMKSHCRAGTPHHGSGIATLGKIVAKIIGACSPINPPITFLAALQVDSEVLYEITEEFMTKRQDIRLVSFFETKMTNFGFSKRLASHSISKIQALSLCLILSIRLFPNSPRC